MFGLAAAPDIVTAVPREIGLLPPYSLDSLYPRRQLPVCKRVEVNMGRFPLLPGKVLSLHQVQRHIHDMQRLACL